MCLRADKSNVSNIGSMADHSVKSYNVATTFFLYYRYSMLKISHIYSIYRTFMAYSYIDKYYPIFTKYLSLADFTILVEEYLKQTSVYRSRANFEICKLIYLF